MSGFHEILFPIDIALGSRGGPQRSTDVVTTGSGREERNQRWFHPRRRYDAGYGIKTLQEIAIITEFFEERRGMLYGFRWRDKADHRSCAPGALPSPLDQVVGSGDGVTATFQLAKTYGSAFAPYRREIRKPVAQSVRVAVNGAEKAASHFTVDHVAGAITFVQAHIPPAGSMVTAGFTFDVPVRFDTDYLEIDIAAFEAGQIPKIPIIESQV